MLFKTVCRVLHSMYDTVVGPFLWMVDIASDSVALCKIENVSESVFNKIYIKFTL